MKKIGLALSGGGFRASLYHLGLVRFLRDAGLLPSVTHITSVSGGSIFAAHLVLNWGRYNGSASEFDAVASELLDFVRLDVRNRIVRRFPLTFALRWPQRLLGQSNRKLTRTGLLEYHYEKYLYGDTGLFQLPEQPATSHPGHQLKRRLPVLFHARRTVDDAASAGRDIPDRPPSHRPGHGADGRHRFFRFPQLFPAR